MDQELRKTGARNPVVNKEASYIVMIAAIILIPLLYFEITVESYIALKEMLIGATGIFLFSISILDYIRTGTTKVRICALDVMVVVFALYSLATVFLSVNKGEGVLAWAPVPSLVIIYFYISRNAGKLSGRFLPAISVSATIVSIITIVFSLYSWVSFGEGINEALVRLKDVLVFPLGGNNFTAAFLTIALPATASLKKGSGYRSFKNKALAIQAAGIVVCFGRIAIAITVLFVLMWLIFMIVKKSFAIDWHGPIAIIIGMVIAVSAFFMLVSSEPRHAVVQDMMIAPEGSAQQGLDSMHMRLFWWKDAIRMIADHPAGVGLGGFTFIFPKYRTIPETFVYPEVRLTTPHNDYLHIASETGFVGLAMFAGIIFLGIAGVVYGFNQKDSSNSEAAFFSFFALIIIALYSLVDFPLFMPVGKFLFYIVLGFSGSFYISRSKKEFSPGKAATAAGFLAVFCALILPGTLWAKNFMAQTHVYKQINSIENHEESLAEFNRAIALNPETKYAYQYAGSMYDKSGDCEKSINMFKKALESDPYDYNVINYLGVAYARCEKPEEALESFALASTIYPYYSNPHLNAGIVYIQNGNDLQAAEQFRFALSLNKNIIEVYIQLADLEKNAGNFKAAAILINKGLEIKPGSPVLLQLMYELHNEMSGKKGAIGKPALNNEENNKQQ